MSEHKHLHRLSRVWIPHAVYFITVCTYQRRSILASGEAANILREEWKGASTRHGWLIGRYVIMPDHAHFFCAEQPAGAQRSLSQFMGFWKEWTAKRLCQHLSISPPFWQKQFFDHVLRNDESYGDKWAYVRDNPVRAGLATKWDDWIYQGFVDFDVPRGCTVNAGADRVGFGKAVGNGPSAAALGAGGYNEDGAEM